MSDKRKTVRLLLASIVAVLLVNVIGVAVFRANRKPKTTAFNSASVREDPVGRAQRGAAVSAIESGNYDKAVTLLTEILKTGTGVGDEAELLRIAKDLQDRMLERQRDTKPEAPAAAPAVAKQGAKGTELKAPEPDPRVAEVAKVDPPPPELKVDPPSMPKLTAVAQPAPVVAPNAPLATNPPKKPARVASARAERVERIEKVPEKPETKPEPEVGQLLVFSVPAQLTVMIDDEPGYAPTPARIRDVPVGAHVVSVHKDGTKLDQRTVTIERGAVATLDFDVQRLLTPKPVAVVVPEEPKPEPKVEPKIEPKVELKVTEPVKAAEPNLGGLGGLLVESPGLYGEIWVNDRPYGFPPARVASLKSGEARIEVRVNGEVKRSKTVTVIANTFTEVRVGRN